MATEALLIRKGKWLAPADPSSEDVISGLRQDEVVTASIRRPRNGRHHAKFFVLLSLVFENQTRYPTLDQLLTAIKLALGYFDEFKSDTKLVYIPKSISFAKMDQTAFEQFYDRAVELICTRILPNTDREDLKRRVEDILNPKH